MADVTNKESTDNTEQSTAALMRQASEQIAHLIRDEMRLLRIEMNEKRKRATKGASMLGAAAVIVLYAVTVLLAAAVFGLGTVLPMWLSALIIGGAMLVIAVVLLLIGKSSLKKAVPPMPKDTMDSLKNDIAAVRERAH
ncbi:MAG TPA: phage holin family protein [Candidatus Stackebrandtia faecavium]|nr:phage holin family protein [Candidatus Stackebrandtia faecavium]